MSDYPYKKSEDTWKESLSGEAYRVLRQKGTEYPHTGKYNMHFDEGTYVCSGCHTPLFDSTAKFESDCGWPSFSEAIQGTVRYEADSSHGMMRTEILCAHCGGHLGHVFDDGPTSTQRRYCVNSVSLGFKES